MEAVPQTDRKLKNLEHTEFLPCSLDIALSEQASIARFLLSSNFTFAGFVATAKVSCWRLQESSTVAKREAQLQLYPS